MPKLIKRASAERPDPRKSLFKQLHLVPKGLYLCTYIFKPNQTYNTATLSTNSFCVREKGEDWAEIRVELLEAYKSGELIAIEFDGAEYEIQTVENPDTEEFGYERKEYGVKLFYPEGAELFFPTGTKSIGQEDLSDGGLPF